MNHSLDKLIKETVTQILEGLNSPIEVNLIKNSDGYYGDFYLEKNHYEIFVDSTSNKEKHYFFKFTCNGSYELVDNLKNAFSIIPTIQKVAYDIIEKEKPNLFVFTKIDSSMGRDRFYVEFCSRIKKEFGYSYVKKELEGITVYILGKDFSKEEYDKTVEKIKQIYTN